MASFDFEQEKQAFRDFYEKNRKHLFAAKNIYVRLITSLIKRLGIDEVTKIEGRVKDKEECIKKFTRKYQNRLEVDEQPYEIRFFISDLIGIRIVCLYEDQIAQLSEMLQQHFRILDITDKISSVERTEELFGYKGLHMDLALNDEMASLPKYRPYADNFFEVQIRSLIQDAWSVLDHKIKYKKSIPIDLKRRINILSALFELADREFKEIRNATRELMQQETVAPIVEQPDDTPEAAISGGGSTNSKKLNAFNFLRIAGHFFRDFEFDDSKVDNFVNDILKLHSGFEKSDFHQCLNDNLSIVKEYHEHFLTENPDKAFSPFTLIRHCLYLYNREIFERILFKKTRGRFVDWLKEAQRNSM
ncbi:(p)ppGpp synthetase [Desulfopila sp. IMCC35006]|uniref:GTP pyrophosphokinase n=1 Tax=Desulfopila sp. IMCC35006 TaxID=2569542 RepID=UPI0010ACCBC2|nr:(p)ppGpp synthetase [Desulfopila sp. IMCC35006]TKB28577.1 (p)ppGpp synthetase [Desulfopila sp. IMCC35006]